MAGEQTDKHHEVLAYFEVERSAKVVNARTGMQANPRLRAVMEVVVKHLHEAVKEAGITSDEWLAAIQFLTDAGQMCTNWRQEFILLSDVLGVSALVDALNHQRPEEVIAGNVSRHLSTVTWRRNCRGRTCGRGSRPSPCRRLLSRLEPRRLWPGRPSPPGGR